MPEAQQLHAEQRNIARIFCNDFLFYIPGYQRPYSWEVKHAEELLDDLFDFMEAFSEAEGRTYFLGSILLVKNKKENPRAEIIDGQQRLVTLTILLSAIKYACNDEKLKNEIKSLIYQQENTLEGTKGAFRVNLRELDQVFFQKYIQSDEGFKELLILDDILKDSQKNIRNNAVYFYNFLTKISDEKKSQLAKFIASRCHLVLVSTLDVSSAYRIFSVLNNRGLDLPATDILKSKIIGKIPQESRDEYTKKWEEMETTLGREQFNDLFGYIRMIIKKAKPKEIMLNDISLHIENFTKKNNDKSIITYFNEFLTPYYQAFKEISACDFNSATHKKEIDEFLFWLNRLDFSDWLPPVIHFISTNRDQPSKILLFVKNIERLSFMLMISKQTVNKRIERYSRITSALEKHEDIFRKNSPLMLEDSERRGFYWELMDGPVYKILASKNCATLLLRLDALLSSGDARYNYEHITVEHVLPQEPAKGSQWLTWFPRRPMRDKWVHKIGNLVLLARKMNSAASNCDFKKKKEKYFNEKKASPFAITSQVLNHQEWSSQIIKDRHENLVELLAQHWDLYEPD